LKVLDIAFKDLFRSLRSLIGLAFMFVIPLLVTGMFYLMFGKLASDGEFLLPRTTVVVANLDTDAPKLQFSSKNTPGDIKANTLSGLVVEVLLSDDLTDLLEVSIVPDAASARYAVDNQQAMVAVIIPKDFSRQFAELYGQASLEFYQDPTLTIGPDIIKSILNQFMDGLAGIKIAVNIAMDTAESDDYSLVSRVVQSYLSSSITLSEDVRDTLLDSRYPEGVKETSNPLASIVTPIMGGMMIFYAYYTGTATAESILREEEERTLPRLFTTPTPQSAILAGKFLAVFLTVMMQVIVLLIAARLIFRIEWGPVESVALAAAGIVMSASSAGIFINSWLKDRKQGGVVFGGVLTFTGMVGMISIFMMNSPNAAALGSSVSLLVPQGWAVRGLMQAINGQPLAQVIFSTLVQLLWSAFFFAVGVWRFNNRYM
jgi:ABC-type Na+ efflux pump permease subunit